MKITRKIRLLLASIVLFLTLVFLLFLFFATRNLLDLWDRLVLLPGWLFYTYSGLILAVVAASVWVVVKLVRGGGKADAQETRKKPLTAEEIEAEIEQIEASGMDTAAFRAELAELRERKQAGQINIAFFGDVSTGKSSIIKAMLPEAGVEISLRGGSTRDIKEYAWLTPANDRLLLTDLPGRNEAEGTLDELVRDEAVRAQIVVYVIDSDLNRTQYADIQELHDFGKPLVIAFNKSDLYSDPEKRQLTERIQSRFTPDPEDKTGIGIPAVVFIQSGGTEEVLRIGADGQEETIQRPRKTDVSALAHRLQTEIDSRMDLLEQLRDVSVFSLVQHKLDSSRVTFRSQQSEKIIRTSTRNAMLGALAAVTPGSDIVIQGVIGTRMVQQLCKLYDVPVKQLDIDSFLNFSQGQLKKSIPLILAVAGNGLKAFPGIGTVAGGLVHAVAYGLIFDALGHSVALTLEERGALKPAPAALTFREMLSGNLEERTKTFARLVVDQYRRKDS